jgi:hypothetical protein
VFINQEFEFKKAFISAYYDCHAEHLESATIQDPIPYRKTPKFDKIDPG